MDNNLFEYIVDAITKYKAEGISLTLMGNVKRKIRVEDTKVRSDGVNLILLTQRKESLFHDNRINVELIPFDHIVSVEYTVGEGYNTRFILGYNLYQSSTNIRDIAQCISENYDDEGNRIVDGNCDGEV